MGLQIWLRHEVGYDKCGIFKFEIITNYLQFAAFVSPSVKIFFCPLKMVKTQWNSIASGLRNEKILFSAKMRCRGNKLVVKGSITLQHGFMLTKQNLPLGSMSFFEFSMFSCDTSRHIDTKKKCQLTFFFKAFIFAFFYLFFGFNWWRKKMKKSWHEIKKEFSKGSEKVIWLPVENKLVRRNTKSK